jgi:hypothetical protein
MRVIHFELCVLAIVLVGGMTLPGQAHAACLSKPASGPNGKQHVIAPKSEVGRYQAMGYALEQCDVPLDQLRRSVENICQMAAAAPDAVQTRVASSHGASLRQLCESGRAGLAEMQSSVKPP